MKEECFEKVVEWESFKLSSNIFVVPFEMFLMGGVAICFYPIWILFCYDTARTVYWRRIK